MTLLLTKSSFRTPLALAGVGFAVGAIVAAILLWPGSTDGSIGRQADAAVRDVIVGEFTAKSAGAADERRMADQQAKLAVEAAAEARATTEFRSQRLTVQGRPLEMSDVPLHSIAYVSQATQVHSTNGDFAYGGSTAADLWVALFRASAVETDGWLPGPAVTEVFVVIDDKSGEVLSVAVLSYDAANAEK